MTTLTTYPSSLVLEGAPGSGKSFTVEQAVREIAQDLEEHCLGDPPRRIEGVPVPVLVRLRDYRSDVMSMIAQALPVDIDSEEIFAWGNGVFFLDGVDEISGELSPNDVLADLSSFLGRAASCTVVFTTRFGEELEPLGIPILSLDEISREYILARIVANDPDPGLLDDETIDLLRRPLYFSAWQSGRLDLAAVGTVHDVYSQLVCRLEAETRSRFGDLAYGEVFGKLAYSMVETGDRSVPVAQVHTALRAVLPREIDVAEFVNHQISAGWLLATPLRRLTFFHHSVAEYFAAQYLARLASVDQGAIRRCLGRRDWDQALLLTLGFLPQERASAVFDDVMSADPTMALRALNYVEAQRADWTERALIFISGLGDSRAERVSGALSRLRVTAANEASLMALTERGGSTGGVAAAHLWDAAPGRRGWLRDLLLDTSRGYNFLSRLVEGIREKLTDVDARALLDQLGSMALDETTERRLGCGEEVHDYVGVMAAMSQVVVGLPVDDRIAYARRGPVLVRCVIAESLRYLREPSAFTFMQDLVLAGDDHAITGMYFQLRYGEPRDGSLPQPLPGLVAALLAAVQENRHSDCAIGTLDNLVQAFPELASQVTQDMSVPGLMPAIAAYAVGDVSKFFDIMEALCANDVDWSTEPVEALKDVEVPWADRPNVLLKLLRLGNSQLARPVLEGLVMFHRGDTGLRCQLDDLEWWIEWLARLDSEGDWFLRDRLGRFLALVTNEPTQRDILRLFNHVNRNRAVLAAYVLPRMPSVSIDDLSVAAVEWLLSELRSRHYTSFFNNPSPLADLATEGFVQDRLIPMFLEEPDDPLRKNLLLTLRNAGVRHGRRYVDEHGALIG